MTASPRLLEELHALSRELAEGAAGIARRRRDAGVAVTATKSSRTDIVTAADQEVESWLRSRIAERRPADGILGEEGDDVPGRSGLTWVVDPIDGTVNYLYGLPHWAVSVAVCAGPPEPARWDLLAGAVCAPMLATTWHAVRGGGAFRGDRRLAPRPGVDLAQALVGTGFAYVADVRAQQGDVVRAVLPAVRDVRRLGSASVDLCLVADGTLDAHFERGLNPWDIAAGCLVVAEAGGVVHGLGGAPPSRDMVVAGARDTAARLAAHLEAVAR